VCGLHIAMLHTSRSLVESRTSLKSFFSPENSTQLAAFCGTKSKELCRGKQACTRGALELVAGQEAYGVS
jgi:hypothetical protein